MALIGSKSSSSTFQQSIDQRTAGGAEGSITAGPSASVLVQQGEVPLAVVDLLNKATDRTLTTVDALINNLGVQRQADARLAAETTAITSQSIGALAEQRMQETASLEASFGRVLPILVLGAAAVFLVMAWRR